MHVSFTAHVLSAHGSVIATQSALHVLPSPHFSAPVASKGRSGTLAQAYLPARAPPGQGPEGAGASRPIHRPRSAAPFHRSRSCIRRSRTRSPCGSPAHPADRSRSRRCRSRTRRSRSRRSRWQELPDGAPGPLPGGQPASLRQLPPVFLPRAETAVGAPAARRDDQRRHGGGDQRDHRLHPASLLPARRKPVLPVLNHGRLPWPSIRRPERTIITGHLEDVSPSSRTMLVPRTPAGVAPVSGKGACAAERVAHAAGRMHERSESSRDRRSSTSDGRPSCSSSTHECGQRARDGEPCRVRRA